MTTSWQTAPLVESKKHKENESASQSQRRLATYATALRAQNIALASQINPTLSAELVVGADAMGLVAEDPMYQQLAQLEQEQSGFFGTIANAFDEAVWDPVKGATRWIGMGFQGLYDEVLVRQSRVAANMVSHGMSYEEAYQESGDHAFGAFGASIAGTVDAFQEGEWKAALGLEGNALNQAEGIFAGSNMSQQVEQELGIAQEMAQTIGTDNDQVTNEWGYQHYGANYAKLSVNQRKMMYLSGRNDEIMKQAGDPSTDLGATQVAFGDPYVDRIRAEEESVLWYQNSIPWMKGESGLGTFTQLSPGRVLSNFLVEPGTEPFHWMSGTIDAGMQIFGDPADIGLGAGVRAAKGARALGLADEGVRLAMDNQRILRESQEQLKTLEASEDYLSGLGMAEVTQARAAKLGRSQFPVEGTGKSVERAQGLQRYGRAQDEADKLREGIRQMQQQPDVTSAVKRSAGILDGSARKTVNPLDTSQFLTGRTATPFVENFVRANTIEEVDALLSHVKTAIPRSTRKALKNADNNADVIGVLLPQIGGAITETGLALVPSLTGGLLKSPTAMIGRTMANINPLVDARKAQYFSNNGIRTNNKMLFGGSALSRRFSQVAPQTLDLSDLDKSYDDLARLGKNLGVERQTELAYKVNGVEKTDTMDDIMERWIDVRDGDFVEAYDVLNDFMAYSFTSLSEGGLDANVAAAVTRFTAGTRDDALWFTNRVGDVVREPNAASKVLANGEEVVNPGPQLITELFNGNVMLPDHNLIRRAVAETDKLGRITNAIALKGSPIPGKTASQVKDFDQRWMFKAADSVLTNIWKPLVLLRFAWPFRVVGEEQMRMSASNLGGMFNIAPGAGYHPLSMIAMAMTKTSDEVATIIPKGLRDKAIGGRQLDVLGDDITQAEDFIAAMSKRGNFDGEVGARGSTYWTTVNKFAPDGGINPQYMDGLVTELNQLWSDPVVQKLFSSFDDEAHLLSDSDKISSMIDWMRTSDGNHWLRELTKTAPKEYADILKTDEGLRVYLEGVNARAHLKAGGEYRYVMENGSFLTDAGTMGMLDETEKAAWAGQSGYEILRPGHQEILDAYGTGKLGDLDIRATLGKQTTEGMTDFTAVKKQLHDLMGGEDALTPNFPQTVKTNKFMQDDVSSMAGTYDRAVNRMFEWFMTRPTNRLSRSPAFRNSYWKRMGDLMPYMDEATQKAAREAAGKADMGTVAEGWRVSKRGADVRAAGKGVEGGNIGSLEEADNLAKAYALTEVEDTLYDLSKKHNISESMSIMMPFVEAYGEVTSTWSKLMTQQWGRPFRRFQQVIESGRESNPFDIESGFSSVSNNNGFFHEDEYGNEVFSASLPVPGAIGGEFNYSLEGLNFVSSIVPGFGPAVQIPANLFLPDDPGWQPVKDMISPFGGDQGNLMSSSLPSYMKRALNAFESGRTILGSESDQELFSNTVIDVMRAKALEDPAEFKRRQGIPEENAAMLQEAKNEARNLYLIRSIATAIGPTSPTFQPLAEDKTGQLWAYNALASEYYKMNEAAGFDQLAATQAFEKKFGIDPAALSVGKTTSIVPRSTAKVGAAFQQQNAALFKEYPATAFFLGPASLEDVADFDYPAYFQQKIAGTRVSRSPEEWQMQVNDFYGKAAYQTMKERVMTISGLPINAEMGALSVAAKGYLRDYKIELKQEYPGYTDNFGTGIQGSVRTVSYTSQIPEIQKMVNDPAIVQEYEAARGAASYFESRDAAMRQVRARGWDTLSTSETSEAEAVRTWLRTKGQEAVSLYPEFGPMWQDVLMKEVRSKADEPLDRDISIAEVVGGS